MNKSSAATVSAMLLVLAGCSTQPDEYRINPDRMATEAYQYKENEAPPQGQEDSGDNQLEMLMTLESSQPDVSNLGDLAENFSRNDSQKLTANELPMKQFIETVFGEQLGVNYIMSQEVQSSGSVTLNIKEAIPSRTLFLTASRLLRQRNFDISLREGIYYIHPAGKQAGEETVIGIGRSRQDVPESVGNILQIVPLRYGVTLSIERTLKNLVSAQIQPDYEQNALFVRGSRAQIMRVIDLVNLLDVPSHRGKHVGLLELSYVSAEEFISKANELLAAEGIKSGRQGSGGQALIMIPVDQIGAVALFAGEQFLIERVQYWAERIDQPTKGAQKGYYIYHPKFSRASDLGSSIAPLIGGSMQQPSGNRSRDTSSAGDGGEQDNGGSSSSDNGAVTVAGDDIRMTVDERSNSVIFYTDGNTYQSLLPIIRQMDVMPKQILLDATIAEVTLTDEFARGFEFAIQNGDFSVGTLGALGAEGIAGLNMNWSDALDEVVARMSASNSLVNVLSNPTLVVRDGVSATISVGNDIPTVGSTVSDPINSNRQTTNINYRKTGVRLQVTPTINAQGLVVLEIDQEISNTSDTGPSVQGSPSIFERAVQTEVIAQSGQTILLGGLISENNSDAFSKVPGFGDVPLLGGLFSSRDKSKTKTELVIFITPRVIENTDQWTNIKARIREGLSNLKLEVAE